MDMYNQKKTANYWWTKVNINVSIKCKVKDW